MGPQVEMQISLKRLKTIFHLILTVSIVVLPVALQENWSASGL